MRAFAIVLHAAVVGSSLMTVAVAPSAASAAATISVAGRWKGPFTGSIFTFEFVKTGDSWTGRYQSEKYNKWVDLQNVTVVDHVVRFSFISTPPSSFALTMDKTGKVLEGTGTFGDHPPLPLTLMRLS